MQSRPLLVVPLLLLSLFATAPLIAKDPPLPPADTVGYGCVIDSVPVLVYSGYGKEQKLTETYTQHRLTFWAQDKDEQTEGRPGDKSTWQFLAGEYKDDKGREAAWKDCRVWMDKVKKRGKEGAK